MILLDTNVISEWMRPVPSPRVIAWLDLQPANRTYVPSIAKAEIETGIALLPVGRRQDALRQAAHILFTEFEGRCLPFDCDAAPIYGAIIARSKQTGHPMSIEDAQIAAIARAHGLMLATGNSPDFEGVDGLQLVDPWEGP